MMNKIFQYDNVQNRVELNVPEILLVKEFAALMRPERNKCKQDPKGTQALRAFREFAYIYLAIDWNSIYSGYDEQERHSTALADSGLTDKEFDDPEFREACRKYKNIQESNKSIKMLKAAESMVDRFIDYFETADPMERDPITGKPTFKMKDMLAEILNLKGVHTSLMELQLLVQKDLEEKSSIRGGGIEDFDPGDF